LLRLVFNKVVEKFLGLGQKDFEKSPKGLTNQSFSHLEYCLMGKVTLYRYKKITQAVLSKAIFSSSQRHTEKLNFAQVSAGILKNNLL
jgi:hypothetical protein